MQNENKKEPDPIVQETLENDTEVNTESDTEVKASDPENTAAGGSETKKKPSVYKKILVSGLIAALIVSAGIFAGFKILALYPYAITDSDDEIICYVKDKETAGEAVQSAVNTLNGDNGDILVVSLGDSVKVDRADTFNVEKEKILSSDDAAEKIIDSATAGENEKNLKEGLAIVSLKTENRKFMPDTVYEKDETSLAGTTVVKEEGKEGLEEVTVSVTTVNGEIYEEEDLDSVTLEEGESPVIVKGVLGVPEGENWETYTGEPVANNGGVITVTAQEYIGKVRYKRGGTSLATGVDCEGFVRAIYRLYGINLPTGLRRQGKHVSYSDARAGDIICYAKHYGIYIGGGKMVHATSGRGVSIGSVSTKKLTDVRRIIN